MTTQERSDAGQPVEAADRSEDTSSSEASSSFLQMFLEARPPRAE